MNLNNQVVVVTGGANGIGRALCEKFAAAGAKVVVADTDIESATNVAASINGIAIATNVGIEEDIQSLVKVTEEQLGPIDIFVSNAGVSFSDAPDWMAASAPNEHWMTSWNVNVMAHVFAARAVVPSMIKRGGGYLVNVASGASLLCQIGDAAYSTTKTAAVGFAESLAITHGDDNIKVSVVCPLYVATAMTEGGRGISGQDEVMTAEEAAGAIFSGMENEAFMIFPHPELKTYVERKGDDYDRWVKGMRRMRQGMLEQHPDYAYRV